MSDMPVALLVSENLTGGTGLRAGLEALGFAVCVVPSCADAALMMHGLTPPHLVFTDRTLPDGTWSEIVSLAESAPMPVSVIVVSRQVEIDTYILALERGAFDFIVPPFEVSELEHIARCALSNVGFRRQLHHTMMLEEMEANEASSEARASWELAARL